MCFVALRCLMSCYVILCYALSCCVMSCDVMFCYVFSLLFHSFLLSRYFTSCRCALRSVVWLFRVGCNEEMSVCLCASSFFPSVDLNRFGCGPAHLTFPSLFPEKLSPSPPLQSSTSQGFFAQISEQSILAPCPAQQSTRSLMAVSTFMLHFSIHR